PDWLRAVLKAIGELANVAGNHARSYDEMTPASIVLRLTNQLLAGYQTYGFTQAGTFPEVVDGILRDPPDYDGKEFYLGGKVVKDMSAEQAARLADRGVTVERNPQKLLEMWGRSRSERQGQGPVAPPLLSPLAPRQASSPVYGRGFFAAGLAGPAADFFM